MEKAKNYEKALKVGRPPNIKRLFPHSRALLVSGKFIDRAMLAKGKAISIAANTRNQFIIRGALSAAQKANAAIILEIAKSEGGRNGYCAVNFWNLARLVDSACNDMNITVPVAIHADHYKIKDPADVVTAKTEVPSLFAAGFTSIAIDASFYPDDKNLLTNLDLAPYVPAWAGLETEVGEIKGSEGLSTKEEALFLIQGLNAHGVFPDWIALNNGTTHGIEKSAQGIQVGLTVDIHEALSRYQVSGAQHGTSGNSFERLREVADRTRTTKANVATALQMVSWGIEVNEYGNARQDQEGRFIKVKGAGMTEKMWAEMEACAESHGWKGGDYKQLNLIFEDRLLNLPSNIRIRMEEGVEEFVYHLMVNVFNSGDTAPIAIEAILAANSHNPGPKVGRVENPQDWTPAKITERAMKLDSDKGPKGIFDD